MVVLAARFAWWSGLRSNFRFRQSLGRGNSPLSVRELRPHFPDSPGGPDGSGPPGLFNRACRSPALATRGSGGHDGRGGSAVVHAPSRSVGSTITQLLDSAGTFFSQLASLNWFSLLLGLALYALYLLLRSRALFGALRAAYPGERIRWRDVWGAYMVGYAINNVFPLGGGNIAQLFLTRVAIPESSLPDRRGRALDRRDLRLVHGRCS